MSHVRVRIPGPLRPFAGDADELHVAAGTVADVVRSIGERHPQLTPRLLTPEGELRPYVNIFVGRDNVRNLQGMATIVEEGSEIRILPAVAGG
jgi:molybdopterin converting factor small subunit